MIKKLTILVATLSLLSGCSVINKFFNGQQKSAPVKNIPMQQTYYKVQVGDSLYDLSRRFNVTERTLILWNKFKSPYVLVPSTTIRIGPLEGEKIVRDGQIYVYQGGTMVPTQAAKYSSKGGMLNVGSKVSTLAEASNNVPVVDSNAAPVNQTVYQSAPPASTQDKESDRYDLSQKGDNIETSTRRIEKSTTGFYTVQTGDSLLEIAVANDVSLSKIQAWNDIKEPSMIYVGQRLRVIPPVEQKVAAEVKYKINEAKEVKEVKESVETSNAKKEVALVTQSSKESSVETKQVVMPEKSKTPDAAGATAMVDKKVTAATYVIPSGKTVVGTDWQWPLKESGKFDKNAIDQQREIAVSVGTKVYAAAEGNVLYAGVGMDGSGEMVIVSHKDGYISAYNNLNSISVKESQDVTQGQLIGEIGKFNGTSTLGFEIRQSGKVQKISDFYTF